MARPVIAFANRLPISGARGGGFRPADGGLVAALRPSLAERDGGWVGWDGGLEHVPRRVDGLPIDLYPVAISRRELEGYYHGFSNRTLWPLLHGCIEQPVLDRAWWRTYVAVNARFADQARHAVPPGSLLWVHDYHLMLLPALLRERMPDVPIGYFLHVPFPSRELFRRMPWRSHLLEGMLGADVVAFHTEDYVENFLRTCAVLLPDVRVETRSIVLHDGRRVRVEAHPISVDAKMLAGRAVDRPVERGLAALQRQFAGRTVLLGVDRLDYTKGILERLRAFEVLLERRQDWRGPIALVQIAVPTRGEVREYRELRADVEGLVGHINGRFTEPGYDVPVHYLHRSVPLDRLLAYYRLADACLVTPLRDGMNLVAKEYCVAQGAADGAGSLVLSEFAGASHDLPGAWICNPYDAEGVALTIEMALSRPEDERRARIAALAEQVHAHDVFAWVRAELSAISRATGGRGTARRLARVRPEA